jgi:bifunctional UDP-N-acetylglucosamine pyrophosphorylase/glucosamine-1-phosphate N-acetyltransferase
MFANKVQAIILAAGRSTRFNTGRTKLLEKICGQEMILYLTRLLESFNIPISVVVGYQKDSIKETIVKYHKNSINFIVQEEQKGTGHAIMCTKSSWDKEHILILNGDVPLVSADIIEKLYEKHLNTKADISFVTSHFDDPAGGAYGRVIKTENSIEIIEARDFKGDISENCCINAGIYLIRKSFLKESIEQLPFHDSIKEFYITDLVKIASTKKRTVSTISASFDRIRGINNFHELWAAEQIKRSDLIKYWMEHGVHFSVAQNVHIDLQVQIGSGSYIGCGVHLLGTTRIGKNCRIHEFASLDNTIIGDNTNIFPFCILESSRIGNSTKIGPFAYIREQSNISDLAEIGNFVEIKKSNIGPGTKAKHLAYLGDTIIGSQVTIGAGTITCNNDGTTKHQTIIHDNAYIASNSTLIAPIIIEKEAFTAAGSVLTDNVPAQALAIARAKQINKEGYASKYHELKYSDLGKQDAGFMAAIKTKSDQTSDAS